MKKFLALVLSLALVSMIVFPALADSNNESIGYIKYSVDGEKTWQKADELIGDYGHRVAFTCAQALFPAAPYDYVYTTSDWKKIEKTWISIRVLVTEGTVSRIWTYSWKQGKTKMNGGYLLELDPGYYEFALKNGEAQNWPVSDSFCEIDLGRIFDQKRNGNANVKNALAFTGVTANLVDRIPDDLKYDDVVDGPVPTEEPNN